MTQKTKPANTNMKRLLLWARLSLGGAVLGIALVSLIGMHWGYDTQIAQTVGAVAGASGAAVLVKLIGLV